MISSFFEKYRDHVIGLILWAGITAVYLQTMATTVEFIDSGELATVPYLLGIAHPTGYPLWTLIGHIFSSLPLADEIAVRMNIFSALLASTAAVAMYYLMLFILRRESDEDDLREASIPAVFASLVLAFSRTFWDQSTSIEVYALHLLLVILVILCFLRAVFYLIDAQAVDQRLWWLFAFVLGLSFTNHLTTVLLAPAFLVLYFSTMRFSKDSWMLILQLAVPFLIGLSVYIYFPIRSVQQPALNWGYPATLERILWHISAKQYRVWMFSSSAVMAKQWGHFTDALPKEFYYAPLLFSALGIWRLLVRNRQLLLFIVLLIAGCVAYTVNYDIKDIDSYFLLAYISFAMLAGFGAVEAGNALKSLPASLAIWAVLAAVVVAEASANWEEADASNNRLAEDYTTNILVNLEPNAIILSYQWDNFVSPSYYYQNIKHLRRDVTVIDKELLRRSWYFIQMNKNRPRVFSKSKDEIESFLTELDKFEHETPYDPEVIEATYNRMIKSFVDHNIDSVAVYVTAEIEPHIAPEYLRVPEGFAFRLYRDSTYHPAKFPAIVYHPYDKANVYATQIHHLYMVMLAERALYEESFRNIGLARQYARKAYELNPTPATQQLYQRLASER